MDINNCKLCDSEILNVKHNLSFLNKYTEPLYTAIKIYKDNSFKVINESSNDQIMACYL